MPVRRKRKQVELLPLRPPMPLRLGVYSSTDWGAPGDSPTDGDWGEWEAAHRGAAAAHDAACRAWFAEFGQLTSSDVPAPDEPFDGSFA
jgi:hypothetical protein